VPYVTSQPVVWKELVGVVPDSNNLTKNGGTADVWDAGAISTKQIMSGDGYMEFTATEISYRAGGLGTGNSDAGLVDLEYGVVTRSTGTFSVIESGVIPGGAQHSYASGDRFRVEVMGGVVRYRRNGVLVHTSTIAPTFPLVFDTALYTPGSTISNAVIAGHNLAP
jgi:hypothetical protein